MEVILLERVEALGQMGDVVSVKAGYARNYLLPRKKALRATKTNLEHFEKQRSALEARNQTRREEAEAAATGFGGLSLVLIRSAGESGQLYGSVTVRDIAEGLAAQGVTVDRRQIELASPIKALGLHTARIRLHPEVAVAVALNVAQSQDEAQAQAAAGLEGEELAEAGISEEAAVAFFEEPARVAHHEDDEEPGEAAGEAEEADERPS